MTDIQNISLSILFLVVLSVGAPISRTGDRVSIEEYLSPHLTSPDHVIVRPIGVRWHQARTMIVDVLVEGPDRDAASVASYLHYEFFWAPHEWFDVRDPVGSIAKVEPPDFPKNARIDPMPFMEGSVIDEEWRVDQSINVSALVSGGATLEGFGWLPPGIYEVRLTPPQTTREALERQYNIVFDERWHSFEIVDLDVIPQPEWDPVF